MGVPANCAEVRHNPCCFETCVPILAPRLRRDCDPKVPPRWLRSPRKPLPHAHCAQETRIAPCRPLLDLGGLATRQRLLDRKQSTVFHLAQSSRAAGRRVRGRAQEESRPKMADRSHEPTADQACGSAFRVVCHRATHRRLEEMARGLAFLALGSSPTVRRRARRRAPRSSDSLPASPARIRRYRCFRAESLQASLANRRHARDPTNPFAVELGKSSRAPSLANSASAIPTGLASAPSARARL